MEFAKPVKVALGRLEHIAFIKRHLDVYKKPDIIQYPIAAYEFDFLDFIYSLGLINILVFVCIILFPTYFKYDPFRVFNIIPIMLLLIANTFLIAAVIVCNAKSYASSNSNIDIYASNKVTCSSPI